MHVVPIPSRPAPLVLRILDNTTVDVNGCWLWMGYRTQQGYGLITVADGSRSGLSIPVHRVVYQLVNGVVPSEMFVCHHCDVPQCCNPEHLFIGTNQENTADKMRKGREARGERQGSARLTAPDVLEIRRRRAAGDTVESLARVFGVSPSTIWFAEIGRTWKHLPGHRGYVRGLPTPRRPRAPRKES
jgi:hypothetical protein